MINSEEAALERLLTQDIRLNGSGWVGLDRVGFGLIGSGRAGSGQVSSGLVLLAVSVEALSKQSSIYFNKLITSYSYWVVIFYKHIIYSKLALKTVTSQNK
jgi:hypothetical protein